MAADRFLVSNCLKLQVLDEFSPFRTWLKAEREKWRDCAESQLNEVALRHAQGRAQMLKEILSMLEDAPVQAKKSGGNTVL